MRNNENSQRRGDFGERWVANYYNSIGCDVQFSLDPYDDQCDMTVDGKSVEVKTQDRYERTNRYGFEEYQFRKCNNVDILVIVESPAWDKTARIVAYYKDTRQISRRPDREGWYRLRPDKGDILVETKDKKITDLFGTYCGKRYHELSDK